VKIKIKIMIHVIAIVLLLMGMIAVHVAVNEPYLTFKFFYIVMDKIFVLDAGLAFILVAFFLEFALTFKPLQVIN